MRDSANKKQTRRQNMAEIVFSWGVSEIKCIILKENNDNPYEIHNNYIELSIVFHPMMHASPLSMILHPIGV